MRNALWNARLRPQLKFETDPRRGAGSEMNGVKDSHLTKDRLLADRVQRQHHHDHVATTNTHSSNLTCMSLDTTRSQTDALLIPMVVCLSSLQLNISPPHACIWALTTCSHMHVQNRRGSRVATLGVDIHTIHLRGRISVRS